MSFRQVLDDTRRELALELIDEGLLLEDVAERCGYTGARALIRAFRRWTGTTPGIYRAASRTLSRCR